MRAILVPVGGMPRAVEVDGLKGLQSLVGGRIESCSWIFDDEPSVYVNDGARFDGQRPNRAVYARAEDAGKINWNDEEIEEGALLDILFGDFVCIGFDPETGEDRDITDEEAAKVFERFGNVRSIDSGWMEVVKIQLSAK